MADKNENIESTTKSNEKDDPQLQDFVTAFRQGTRFLHQGLAQESIPYLERAVLLQPDHLDAAINLSGAYIMTKKFKKAAVILESLSRQHPDHAKIWINLGAAYLGNPILAGKVEQEKAIFAFEQALKADPAAPSVAYNIGLIYRDRKERDQAIYWFRQAIQHNPNDKDAKSHLQRLETQ